MTNEEVIAQILDLQRDTAQQLNSLAKHQDGLTHSVELMHADMQALTKTVSELARHSKRQERVWMQLSADLWSRLMRLEEKQEEI